MKSNRIETEVRRDRGWPKGVKLSRDRGLMNVKLDVKLEGNLRILERLLEG